MKVPLSTGQAAALLETTEPAMAELVRRGRIQPNPVVFAGRRLWYRDHLIQAAKELERLTPELERKLQDVPIR